MKRLQFIAGFRRVALAPLYAIGVLGFAAATQAQGLPDHLKSIIGTQTSTPAGVATKDVLQLNTTMFELYGDAAAIFQKNLLAKHPVILALFSGEGGRLTLYRPNLPPLDAPKVPIVYQLLKSVGHSTMALSEVVVPYLDSPNDKSWQGSLTAYRDRMKKALDGVDAMPMQADWRDTNRDILKNNVAFMDECLAKGVITLPALQAFAEKQRPLLKLVIAWAAETQVGHWMGVLDEWKKMLGADWDKTYGMSNTIYVARQNNILFSVMAQYFGPEAINSRLMLIETVSFTTTQQDMLEALTRIVADRSVGALFFGNYHLMDYELMGGNGRAAIIAESKKRGVTPFLPPVVPFGSKQWPTLISGGSGAATLADLP